MGYQKSRLLSVSLLTHSIALYRMKNTVINKIKSLAAHPYKLSVSKRGARFSVPGIACHVHLNRLNIRGNK